MAGGEMNQDETGSSEQLGVTMDRANKAPWPEMPQEPPPGLLMSMAIRFDHGLGVPGYYNQLLAAGAAVDRHAVRLELTLRTMRQLYEEVSGYGFYSKDKEAEYAALASHTPTDQPEAAK